MTHRPIKTQLGLLCASLALLAACSSDEPTEVGTASATRVKVVEVEAGPSQATVQTSGVAAYRDERRLSFKVGGVVERISVREGQAVQAGQELARLQQAELAAGSQQAQAAFDKAQRDYARGQTLRADEVIAEVQLENLKTALDVARAQLAQARFNLGTGTITAPAPGIILRRLAQEGEVLGPGQPALLLGDQASGFVLRASLADKQAVQLALGNQGTVEFDAHPGVQWPATVLELSQAADPLTGSYGLALQLDTAAHQGLQLLSGMQGRARINPAGGSQQASYVPIESVVEGNNRQAWVYVLQPDNTVQRQAVEVAFIEAPRLALKTALPPGTKVVSTGAAYLQDGQAVTIVE